MQRPTAMHQAQPSSRFIPTFKNVHLATDYRTPETTRTDITNTGLADRICNTSNGHFQPIRLENDLHKRATTHRRRPSGTQTWSCYYVESTT